MGLTRVKIGETRKEGSNTSITEICEIKESDKGWLSLVTITSTIGKCLLGHLHYYVHVKFIFYEPKGQTNKMTKFPPPPTPVGLRWINPGMIRVKRDIKAWKEVDFKNNSKKKTMSTWENNKRGQNGLGMVHKLDSSSEHAAHVQRKSTFSKQLSKWKQQLMWTNALKRSNNLICSTRAHRNLSYLVTFLPGEAEPSVMWG